MPEEHWIQKAVGKPGALHEDLSIPQGQKIPQATLRAAANRKGVVGRRARLAMTLEGLNHKKRKVKRRHAAAAAPAPPPPGAPKPKFGSPAWDAMYHIKRFGEK